MKRKLKEIIFLFFILNLNANSQLDPSRPIEDWSHAGYRGEIPRGYSSFINMVNEKGVTIGDDNDDAIAIQNAVNNKIANSPNTMTIFYFPAGTYKIKTTIVIPDGAKNILFLGAGSANTKFEVTNPISGFSVYCNNQSEWTDLTNQAVCLSTMNENASVIKTPTNISIQSGDFIEIVIKNGSWLGSYKSTNPQSPSENEYQVGQIVKVTSVQNLGSELQLTLEDKLRMTYGISSLNPKVRKINTVSNIGFENFSIENTKYISDSEIQQDESDNHLSIYNFLFSYVVDSWIWGIESIKPLNSHVTIAASSGIEIRGSYFHEAKGYGGGGHGYGISIGNHTTNCLVEDNVMLTLKSDFC